MCNSTQGMSFSWVSGPSGADNRSARSRSCSTPPSARAAERLRRGLLSLLVAAAVLAPRGASAYSVLAHESSIDALWDSQIRPALLAKYPGTSAERLRLARAYAY